MSLEKDMIEAQWTMIKKSGGFTCCSCNRGLVAAQAGEVKGYRPERGDPTPGRNKVGLPNVAVYVLCRDCEDKPWENMRVSVLKHLAKSGLFKS